MQPKQNLGVDGIIAGSREAVSEDNLAWEESNGVWADR